MHEQNSNPIETQHSHDNGTYQTGPAKPPKRPSVLITVLLMCVIFLGGIASALGVMNLRLFNRLMQQNEALQIAGEGTAGASHSPQLLIGSNHADFLVPSGKLRMQFASGTDAQELSEAELHSSASTCTVQLTVSDEETSDCGVGLVLDKNGYIVANASLVDGRDTITVTASDGSSCNAILVASDVYTDLAVLYVENSLPAAQFSLSLSLSAPIWGCDSKTLTQGALQREIRSDRFRTEWIGTDLTDYTGPVFNSYAQVVGFQCKIGSSSAMLSSRQLESILSQLVEDGSVSGHPQPGFRVRALSAFCRRYWGLDEGVQVTSVDDSVSSVGLREDDILLRLNGEPLQSAEQLYTAIADAKDGDTLRFELLRVGNLITLELTAKTGE